MQGVEPAIKTLGDAKVLLPLSGKLLAVGFNGNHADFQQP